ncbi:MAG TPA: MMPL family transporter [Polyangiaceae bacterium]|jgi:predicted RND superfamily exporter protein|nr:MMPL family transporter [Polyangiaceae bacterium]
MAPSGPSPALRAFVFWTVRRGPLLWIVALLLGAPAAYRTAYLYLHLHGEVEELLPREAPSVRALDALHARSPGLEFLGVVTEVPDAALLPQAERFLDDLAARIRTYPPALVRDVRANNVIAKRFVEDRAPLYTDLGDLEEILRRIEARRDYEVTKEGGSLLDEDEKPPSLDMDDVESKYKHRTDDVTDRMDSVPLKAALITVETNAGDDMASRERALLDRVKADVAALEPETYAAGLRVGFASDVAINVEEKEALEADLSLSSVLVIFAVMAVIVLYYGWWMSVPVLIPPLLLATVYAFGAASLPPFDVTALNSNTAFLGSIIIGNGINVGLILLARYREERMRGLGVDDALVVAVWGARTGTFAAAFAASVSYASLAITEFRGFRQFGYIGGIGMLASWVTAFLLVPPLLKWLDREPPRPRRTSLPPGLGTSFVSWIERRATVIVVIALALTASSIALVRRFDTTHLEYDFNKLRRADTWKSGEGYWGRKMDAILGHYLTPTVILCDTTAHARAIETLVRDSVEHGDLGPLVARVVSAKDVLPEDQPAKIAEVQRIREALTPKIRSLLTPQRRDQIDKFLGPETLAPFAAADLPASLTTGLREKDGSIGRALLVYPRPSNELWRVETMHRFVSTLRGLAATGSGGDVGAASVAGSIPLSSDILNSVMRDAPIAILASFAGVVAVVLVVLRAKRASFYVIGSLVFGVLWLAGAMMALGIKINFTNFIAFPITLGIGVDYSVNVMTRYVLDGERDVQRAVRATGGAVALCSLTTIIGYSSLLLAKNRALFLFGLLAVLGEVACLTAAVIALPAFLALVQRRRKE